MKHWHCCLCDPFLAASLRAASSAETSRDKAWTAPTPVQPDEAFLARLCEQQRGGGRPRLLPRCKRLHARRRGHHLPMPPPSRDGEQVDARYGVSKRLVPSGPNKLHR